METTTPLNLVFELNEEMVQGKCSSIVTISSDDQNQDQLQEVENLWKTSSWY